MTISKKKNENIFKNASDSKPQIIANGVKISKNESINRADVSSCNSLVLFLCVKSRKWTKTITKRPKAKICGKMILSIPMGVLGAMKSVLFPRQYVKTPSVVKPIFDAKRILLLIRRSIEKRIK